MILATTILADGDGIDQLSFTFDTETKHVEIFGPDGLVAKTTIAEAALDFQKIAHFAEVAAYAAEDQSGD